VISPKAPQKYSSKLIFVDGLPGSGKSATAQFVALQLQRNKLEARWFYEVEEPHPVHYWDAGNKDDFAQKSLQLWRALAASAYQSEETTVLESSLFQRTLGLALARYEDVNEKWLEEYYTELQNIVADHAPILVYFYPTDVASFVEKVFAERGDEWTQWFIGFVTQAPISKQRNWHGFEGVVAFLELYKALCGNLVSRFPHSKIAIENSGGEWTAYYQQIMDFLDLPLVADAPVAADFSDQVVGKYRGEGIDFECEVRFVSGQLAINNIWWPAGKFVPLITNGSDCFLIRGSPLELKFEQQGADDKTWRVCIHGNWEEYNGKVLYRQRGD